MRKIILLGVTIAFAISAPVFEEQSEAVPPTGFTQQQEFAETLPIDFSVKG